MNRHLQYFFISCFFLILAESAGAQQIQTWLEYNPRHRFSTESQYIGRIRLRKTFETFGSAQYQLQNLYRHYLAGWLSLHGSLDLFYTRDPEIDNVFELRPWAMAQFYWQTYGKFLNLYFPYLGIRFDQRFLWYAASNEQDTQSRIRLRAGTRFTLNNDLIDDDTWFLHFRLELYFELSDEVTVERYADQNRLIAGVGYNFDRDMRAELRYVLQNADNNIGARSESTDSIFHLIFTQYF